MPFTRKDISDFIDFFNFVKIRKINGVVYQNLFFVGFLCWWFIYLKSNHLLIPIKDLSIVGVATDVLITLCFFRFYKKNFSLFWALLHNLTLGLIACYLFVWTNENFSSRPVTTEILQIENVDLQENHRRYNHGLEPVLTVNIKGIEHEITYDRSATKSALNARQVEVKLKEGVWGYWVLADIRLITDE